MTYQNELTTSYLYVKQSDLYPASHFRSGLFFCALVLMAVYFLPFNWEDPIWLLYIEVGAFFIGYLLAYTKRFKKLFTFKSEMKEEVHQKALESLREYGLLHRNNHVFLFASLIEKRIECLLSPDLEDKLDQQRVLLILKNYKSMLQSGRIEDVMGRILEEIRGLLPAQAQEKPKIEVENTPLLQQESSESLPQADLKEENRPDQEESQTISE